MTETKAPRRHFYIPGRIRVVFVFPSGKKQLLNTKSYGELSEFFVWMATRLEEFQRDVERLEGITRPGAISILELYSDGEKGIFQNLNFAQYSLE